MKKIKLYEEFKQERTLAESLDQREVMNILDAAAGFADDAEVAANQTWRDRKDLIKYLLSDHIAKKDHKKFLAMVGESLEVNEEADWGTYDTPEGKMVSKELEKAWIKFAKTVDAAHKDWLKTVQKYRGEAGKGSGFRDSEGRDAVVSAMEWFLEKVFMVDNKFGGINYGKYRKLMGESVEINEAVKVDTDLAQITLDVLADEGKIYDQLLYIPLYIRDMIKDRYGRLPRGFAGPTKYMMAGEILSPLAGDAVYVDGGDLVKGDKTVMRLKKDTTWADVKKALKL